jgi:hypothetical protein
VFHIEQSSSVRRLRPLVLRAGIAITLSSVSALAGDFTMTILTGDANSGINSGLTYTAVADFFGPGTRTLPVH